MSITSLPLVDLTWGVHIPMRDGVRLNGTLYRPPGESRIPAIFTMTPYIADSYHERAMYFSQRGYAFMLVDCRGRGNSEGVFDGMGGSEARDGHDVVEWLADQPWCTGQVTMWGGSYAGMNQWSTASTLPPHLTTIVPAAAAHPGVDFPRQRNMAFSYEIQWATFTSGRTGNGNLFTEYPYWISKFREMYLNHRPFRELDQIAGNPCDYFQRIVDHPTVDESIEALAPSPDDYRRLNLPILTITGHYDDDQLGAMAFYRRHMVHGSADGKAQHYLIIGPWDHAGTRTPKREVGGLTFGEACLLDLNDLHMGWYDWVMKGGPKPEFLHRRVAYYVTGADVWKYADNLDSIADETLTLYLDSQGSASDVFASGRLAADPPARNAVDTFVYDPLDVRPASLETKFNEDHLTDQRPAHNLFGNGVVYHSAPFHVAAEITGNFRLTIWISMDVPDTDFVATVYELLPDGSSILLSEDRLRARYRESLHEQTLVTPGEITEYVFDWFPFISRQIAQGSRLRLLFRCVNSIYWEKNYNSGGVIAEETAADSRTAHVTVHHSDSHPSRLEIPFVRL